MSIFPTASQIAAYAADKTALNFSLKFSCTVRHKGDNFVRAARNPADKVGQLFRKEFSDRARKIRIADLTALFVHGRENAVLEINFHRRPPEQRNEGHVKIRIDTHCAQKIPREQFFGQYLNLRGDVEGQSRFQLHFEIHARRPIEGGKRICKRKQGREIRGKLLGICGKISREFFRRRQSLGKFAHRRIGRQRRRGKIREQFRRRDFSRLIFGLMNGHDGARLF